MLKVFGATGHCGREVVKKLTEKGIETHAFVRDVEKAAKMLPEGMPLHEGDMADPQAVLAAFVSPHPASRWDFLLRYSPAVVPHRSNPAPKPTNVVNPLSATLTDSVCFPRVSPPVESEPGEEGVSQL
eukprot:3754581-Rhodomonas_salina.1